MIFGEHLTPRIVWDVKTEMYKAVRQRINNVAYSNTFGACSLGIPEDVYYAVRNLLLFGDRGDFR